MRLQPDSLTSFNASPTCWSNILESARQPRTNAAGFRSRASRTPSSIGKLRPEFVFWSCATRTVIPSTDNSAAKNRASSYAKCEA